MKNDRIGSDLKNELSRIKMSPELQSQILYAVAREKRRRPFFSGAAFAAAAVVIVAISAAGLALMQRGETPDNVTSPGGNISPAGITSPAATYMNTPVPEHAPDKRADLSGMWINGEDNMFHLYKACAEMNGCTAYISDNAENEALSPCPECFCDCLWIDNATDMFHEDYDCPMLYDPYPVNMGILAKTDYVSCSECAGETASEVIETAPAIAPENIEPTSALSTPEPTQPASQDPSPKVVYRHSENGTEVILTG